MQMIFLKYGQMILSVELVTPVIAARWLENNARNRRLRERTAAQYRRDMEADAWERKPVAVCFDEAGELGNGQHTLHAIKNSGRSQELLIARNVPRKAIAFMDMGIRRSVSDIARFLDSAALTSRAASIARIIRYGVADTSPRSFEELYDAYLLHGDVIDWATERGKEKTVGFSAPVLAVMARAAYTEDRCSIARFAEVLRTGVVTGPHESAAIRFRDFARSLRGAVSKELRQETYHKAESALSAFLKAIPMARVYGTSVEMFPVPKEDAA